MGSRALVLEQVGTLLTLALALAGECRMQVIQVPLANWPNSFPLFSFFDFVDPF